MKGERKEIEISTIKFIYFLICIVLLFICAYNALSLSPPLPQYPAETILPSSLILLKREYKQ
jgi:hypothetical protein